jgi:hypothetical protein
MILFFPIFHFKRYVCIWVCERLSVLLCAKDKGAFQLYRIIKTPATWREWKRDKEKRNLFWGNYKPVCNFKLFENNAWNSFPYQKVMPLSTLLG